MDKVVVTGATGFIGSALTNKLLKLGKTVYGVDISADKLSQFSSENNFHPIIAVFSSYQDLADKISDDGIDVFYHFAWQGVLGAAFNDYSLQEYLDKELAA